MARSVDYTKLDSRAIEERAVYSRGEEVSIKKAGFQHRMDRVNESLKNASTQKEQDKFQKIKKQTLGLYNKYNSRNYNA